jgi:hypothetical protein
MSTDFERELSQLLHSVTPDPPAHLASPHVRTLQDLTSAKADAMVIELAPGAVREHLRRDRWSLAAAAAAVAALAAGVIALIQGSGSDDPSTRPPAGQVTSNATTVPPCRANQLVLEDGPPLATNGPAGTAHFSYLNRGAGPCEAPAPSVAITVTVGAEPTGGWRFPTAARPVRIPGHGQIVFTALVRVTGRCHTVTDGGFQINVTAGSTTGSYSLGVTGCALTPVDLTYRVVG